ncbi:magnesium/cobalt transporter CorA [bacterium]|nr:magnesium/cobalt transporter CorA [bacterium]
MARFFKNKDVNRGLSPDTLVFIGHQKMENPRIRVIDFDQDNLKEDELKNIKEGLDFLKTNTISWINIDGLHDLDLIKEIGATFELHPLLLEDLLNTGQRPKLEDFENCLFVTLKMIRYNVDKGLVTSDQFSVVIGKTFLLTFQEKPGDWFEPVRKRIRKQKSRIRVSGADYLAYALLDTIVDNYIHVIEQIGGEIEDLEDEVLSNPDSSVMERINFLRREMNFLRKSIRPAREAILEFTRLESDLVQENTFPFLRDLLDLINQASEAIDTYREMLTDHLNIYNSVMSNRMNDIMKVLTVFAAIFIPLTFIAGVYGTNFKFLPELEFKYGYFVFWLVLIIVAFTMLFYFRRKKWL